jgi:hypothetical protein
LTQRYVFHTLYPRMNIRKLMEEYDLSIDDVRWYLSCEIADSLLLFKDTPNELSRLVWSGELEGRIYDMEERFLASLQDELDRGLIDEPSVRSHFESARIRKLRRL